MCMCYVNALASFVTLNPLSDHDGAESSRVDNPGADSSGSFAVMIVTSNIGADSRIIVLTLYRDKSPTGVINL